MKCVYCSHCVDYLKSCGYPLFVGDMIDSFDVEENNIKCEFCDGDEDDDELYEVIEED